MAWKFEHRHCPSCGAEPGELCRRENGHVAWYHVPRTGDKDHRPGPGFWYPSDG